MGPRKPAPRAQCEGFCPQQVLWTIATKWGVFRKEVGASLPGERSWNPDTVPTTRTSARLRLRQCWASIFPADLRLDESPIRDSGGRNLPHGELDLPEREVGFDISHVWLPIIVFGGDPIISRLVSRPPCEKSRPINKYVSVPISCAGWDGGTWPRLLCCPSPRQRCLGGEATRTIHDSVRAWRTKRRTDSAE